MNLSETPKNVINSVCQFPEEYRNRILKMALLAYQPSTQNWSKIIDNFSNDTGMHKKQIYEVVGIYIGLIRFFLESSTSNEFNNRLLEIGFTPDFIEKLPFVNNGEEIRNNLNNCNTEFAKLSSLKWKIDISLSDSTLVKKIPATIILCLTLKNGDKYTIEVDTKTFHKLRFNIALLLKELNLFKSNFFK